MGKLDKLKELIDRKLGRMTFTRADADRVYEKIEARKKQHRRNYTIGFSATAAVCCAAMLALLVLPAFDRVHKQTGNDLVADVENSVVSDNSAADETPQQVPQRYTVSKSVSGVEITALSTLSSGLIATDTGFSINTENSELNAEELSGALEIEPAVGFTMTMEGENLCLITLDEELPDGDIITLSVEGADGEHTWAFQTASTLSVLSTLPGNDSNGMPLDTGIEMNFSRIITSGAEEYIEISPALDGSFLYRGKTLIFVPSADLDRDTIYTVTIRAGLTASTGEVLEDDYVFSFRTPFDYTNGYSYLYTDALTQTYTPEEAVAFTVYATSDVVNQELSLDIYALDSAQEYLDYSEQSQAMMHPTLGSSRDVRLDLSGKTPMISTTARITSVEVNYSVINCVFLPELEEGWYVAELRAQTIHGEIILHKLIQVSAVSVYYQSINGEGLFWLNSATSGEALSDAQIDYTIGDAARTISSDYDGLAAFTFDETDAETVRVQVDSAAGEYAEVLTLGKAYDLGVIGQYQSFVYLDRAAYLPSDTIRFWGTILPREADGMLPESVEVQISGNGAEPRHLMDLSVGAGGTFTGEFSIENYVSGYHTLHFCIDGEMFASTGFEVVEYTKPSYVLTLSLDKEIYRAGETITATARATFYDGTPAEGVKIVFDYYGASKTVNADRDGYAVYTFTPKDNSLSWLGQYIHVSAMISGMEDVYVWSYASAEYFRSDEMLTIELVEGKKQLNLYTNKIDFAKLSQNLDSYTADYDSIRGDEVTLSGSIQILKHYYEKIPTGSYYDEIEKRRVDTFDYIYHEEAVKTIAFTTENGVYHSPDFQLPDIEYGWYSAVITYSDASGLQMEETRYISTQQHPYHGPFYTWDYDGDSNLKLDETLDVQLFAPDGTAVDSGRLLCTLVTDKIVAQGIETDGDYTVTYTEDCIPNVRLYAAYFDGEHVHTVYSLWFAYDFIEQKLNIEILPGSDEYEPGADASVKLRITDASGEPVETGFVLSIVDEAAFAVQEQYVNPLASLYTSIYPDNLVRYASYTNIKALNIVAEGGGEGGTEGLRENFKDTAAFITGTTDASGEAVIRYTLPDNLTSWRLTAVAVTDDAQAGVAKENVVTTLDFFVNLVLDDAYAVGDDLAMSVRVYGASKGETVEYEVYIDDEYIDSWFGKAGEFTFINLGKYDTGRHEVAVRAICGDLTDGLIRPVEIKASRHSFLHYTTGLLSDGISLSADRYPAKIMFYDSANETYMRVLSTLMNKNFSRIDRYLGYVLAYEKLSALNETVFDAPEYISWQEYTGGAKLMPYADANAYITAMALATMPQGIDVNAAVNYLYGVLNDYQADSLEIAAAYMGLAAQGEPVLGDVHVLMEQFGETSEEYYYLTCALALLGDRQSAESVFVDLYGDRLVESFGKVYVDAASDDQRTRETARALLLTSLLGRREAEAMAAWLIENPSNQYLANFELMAFVNAYTLREADSEFTCRYDGKTLRTKFKEQGIVVLEFNHEELKNANFQLVSGEISYIAIYSSGVKKTDANAAGLMQVNLKTNVAKASLGATVSFTLSFTAYEECPDLAYIVDVVLPTGVRFTGYDHTWSSPYSLVSNENGRLRFCIRRDTESDFSVSFNIRAVAVLPGEYVIEAPAAQAPNFNLLAVGDAGTIIFE